MSDFDQHIRSRLADTQEQLARARAEGDDHLVNLHLGELDSLARIADDHGVRVEGVREALTGSLPLISDREQAEGA